MPNRNIREEARGVRERESEIARELRIAREDFNQAEREYRLLSNEYKKMDDIHLKKVRHGKRNQIRKLPAGISRNVTWTISAVPWMKKNGC